MKAKLKAWILDKLSEAVFYLHHRAVVNHTVAVGVVNVGDDE